MPAATTTLLDDTAVDIDEWIAEEVRDGFAQQEGAAFVNGDGNNQPKGLLSYTKIARGVLGLGQHRLHRDRRRRVLSPRRPASTPPTC